MSTILTKKFQEIKTGLIKVFFIRKSKDFLTRIIILNYQKKLKFYMIFTLIKPVFIPKLRMLKKILSTNRFKAKISSRIP